MEQENWISESVDILMQTNCSQHKDLLISMVCLDSKCKNRGKFCCPMCLEQHSHQIQTMKSLVIYKNGLNSMELGEQMQETIEEISDKVGKFQAVKIDFVEMLEMIQSVIDKQLNEVKQSQNLQLQQSDLQDPQQLQQKLVQYNNLFEIDGYDKLNTTNRQQRFGDEINLYEKSLYKMTKEIQKIKPTVINLDNIEEQILKIENSNQGSIKISEHTCTEMCDTNSRIIGGNPYVYNPKSVCTMAKQQGITGKFYIVQIPQIGRFFSSDQNGITSESYDIPSRGCIIVINKDFMNSCHNINNQLHYCRGTEQGCNILRNQHNVWGSQPYCGGSDICGVGVHSRIIDKEFGGFMVIDQIGNVDNYTASTQNGITSYQYGPYEGYNVY